MADIKLFHIQDGSAYELESSAASIEKSLQTLIERNLESLLGVRWLGTEYRTGKTHDGRIDTLGIDENDSPVIIEYKRSLNENVINQGLFYLDWLLDHQAEFKLLVLDKYGKEAADAIDWSSPRLVCIAGDFTRYDEYAVQQMNRNIELIRYRLYENDLLLFEQVNAITTNSTEEVTITSKNVGRGSAKTISEYLEQADLQQRERYESLRLFLSSLGDDVQIQILKHYVAFRRIKNFACVAVHTQTKNILVWVKVNPDTVELEPGFTRDVRNIGHHGTGDLEIIIGSDDDLEKAKPLLIRSYESS
jgi:predicted transport protein